VLIGLALALLVGMLLGGALGNLADRARIGAVIDFIDPIAWPAFNLADAAIVLGVVGLLYVIEGPPGRAG
jgi:signal peptidase II